MINFPRVIRTKITPPPSGARTLARPRVTQALAEAIHYRLTILQAGAGYGKSTALSVLAEEVRPVLWYQLMEEDGDALIFLLHLCHATRQGLGEVPGLPTHVLETWEGSRGPLPSSGIVDEYINALSENLDRPALLVLDDVHLALASPEVAHILDRLIGLAPPNLHILLAGRPPLQLPNLTRWRAQGDVLLLDQSVLAFTAAEITALFAQQYGYELTSGEVTSLVLSTEGWAIALKLIWQSLRSGSGTALESFFASAHTETGGELNAKPAGSLESLFAILAAEVFAGQPDDVQQFLLVSATLREMTPEACHALGSDETAPAFSGVGLSEAGAMLAYLRRQELFVVESGDGSLRYHHIFHSFLRQQAPPEQRKVWHRRAAAYFQSRQDLDSAIYHLQQAEDPEGAAQLIDGYGAQLLAAGRLDTLAAYLDAIPPQTLRQHPALFFFLGELARLHSRFSEALGWYVQSESAWRERGQAEGIGRALRGQARVYLDTVNPSKAEELLEKATRLSDGMDDRASQARLYELLAENKLNAGRVAEAERLFKEAEALRSAGPSDSQLSYRVLLRTGRLEEARVQLEARAEAEQREPVHTPRAHRETLLLLSLIYAMQGRGNDAYNVAQQGTQRGADLQSPFITAVGYARQGHALLLIPGPERYQLARQQFEKTVELSRTLSVPRLLVEACWGLCRAFGYQGDLAQAQQVAQEGIEIAVQAGDEWIASLLRLSMGASLTLAARYEAAEPWLAQALRGFHECSDPFGRTAAQVWLCLGAWGQKAELRLAHLLPEALSTCRQNGYDFLFTRPSTLGPPDERQLTPLLLAAREQGWEAGYVERLLKALGLSDASLHPGYQLRVYSLGAFNVWRGEKPVPANGWRREKARQLFQLLLTHREAPLDRDQITEALWPEMEPSAAHRSFKVALNTLYQVLEPDREPGRESAYIVREGSTYGLRPGADLWLDAVAFTNAVRRAESLLDTRPETAIETMQFALELYTGEYLPDARYDTWSAAEREHLAVLFLRTADRLSEQLLERGHCEEAIQVCQRLLANDNCWERAYRHLMVAFDRLGDHGQVARTYQRCLQTLRQELDVAPSPETEALYAQLTHPA